MSNHTPGPWHANTPELERYADNTTIRNTEGEVVAINVMANKANAKLMAAAPELLDHLDSVSAALETMLVWYGDAMPPEDARNRRKIMEQARALVASLHEPVAN
jgi:hypothetical protein